MTDSLKIKEADKVPLDAKKRIAELLALPLNQKQNFIPPVGLRLNIGPFIYEITFTNVSQLRFTATLVNVNVEKKEDKPKKLHGEDVDGSNYELSGKESNLIIVGKS